MTKVIQLQAERLENESAAVSYMHAIFRYPSHSSKDMKDMEAWISKSTDDIQIVMDNACVHGICQNAYAYQILLMLGRGASNNRHLKIQFKEDEKQESYGE